MLTKSRHCSRPVVARGQASMRVTARASRGVLILPGLGNNAADYEDLAAALSSMDLEVNYCLSSG